jgi:hypothetical protein
MKDTYRKTFKDHSDQPSRASTSSSRPFDPTKTKAEALEQRERVARVERGEDKGKYNYNMNVETSVDEHGRPLKDKIVLSDRSLKGGMWGEGSSWSDYNDAIFTENIDDQLLKGVKEVLDRQESQARQEKQPRVEKEVLGEDRIVQGKRPIMEEGVVVENRVVKGKRSIMEEDVVGEDRFAQEAQTRRKIQTRQQTRIRQDLQARQESQDRQELQSKQVMQDRQKKLDGQDIMGEQNMQIRQKKLNWQDFLSEQENQVIHEIQAIVEENLKRCIDSLLQNSDKLNHAYINNVLNKNFKERESLIFGREYVTCTYNKTSISLVKQRCDTILGCINIRLDSQD